MLLSERVLLLRGQKGYFPQEWQTDDLIDRWLRLGGGQEGKPSVPVGMTSVVHDGMPVIHDPDGYDQ